MNKYFKGLIDTIDKVEQYNNELEYITQEFQNRFNGKGRIILLSAGPIAYMNDYLTESFKYLFKFDWDKLVNIQPGKSYEDYFPKNSNKSWRNIENEKSIGAIDTIEMNVTKDDFIIAFSVTGKTNYINQFIKQSKEIGARTALITSSPHATNDIADVNINLPVENKMIKGLYIGNHTTILKLIIESIFFKTFEDMGQIYNGMILTTNTWTNKLKEISMSVLCEFNSELSIDDGKRILEESDNELSVAILKLSHNIEKEEAKKILEKNNYDFKLIFESLK